MDYPCHWLWGDILSLTPEDSSETTRPITIKRTRDGTKPSRNTSGDIVPMSIRIVDEVTEKNMARVAVPTAAPM